MKKILIFGAILGILLGAPAVSAVRDNSNVILRKTNSSTPERTTAAPRSTTDNGRTATTRNVVSRNATPKTVTTRASALRLTPQTRTATTRPIRQIKKSTTRTANLRNGTITARASTATTVAETRTGAAYNQCKDAYFQCMDQFCQLKNDDYRRCSCSDRIRDLQSVRDNISDTNTKLTEFTENLDVVGLTADQATAMHTASDGENALAADTSASKALLDAIMKSIRGNDATVSGKLADLNSINLSFDTTNAFGMSDTAQVIASYDGLELYNAVYPSCRSAVKADCTDAALQRAVTAYLMAIEQDCNTVQTALVTKQKELKAAIREGGAMLDLARIENRHNHNSDDLATCINNIEAAVLSEQVCGANYHKCLDNGEFIDVSTGAPISGVVKFYELGNLLKFDSGKDAVNQKLSTISNNQKFVKSFENKTKKFARDAMDKCVEIADTAWSEYLDRALLAIYYAQQSKVETIKNGCFDLISACYADKETAITAAMSSLVNGESALSLMPDKVVLTQQMCSDYITSCNNMFANDENNRNVIAEYITQQTDKDRLDACRAIVQQCFTNFGGTNYENFYHPSSGIFTPGKVDSKAYSGTDPIDRTTMKTALDWFTLYRYGEDGEREIDETTQEPIYVSECAKQIAAIDSCADLVEKAFGGMDTLVAKQEYSEYGAYIYSDPSDATANQKAFAYGWANADDVSPDNTIWTGDYKFQNRRLRPTGIATDVYNNIIDTLSTQCMNADGKFVEAQFINHKYFDGANLCLLSLQEMDWWFGQNFVVNFVHHYGSVKKDNYYGEYMCPKDYHLTTDTPAWGVCSCWDNGGRRSKDGLIGKCMTILPIEETLQDQNACADDSMNLNTGSTFSTLNDWCTSKVNKITNQVCPFDDQGINGTCTIPVENGESIVPDAI